MTRVICLVFLGLCLLFHASKGQVFLKLAKHYADQEKACVEFESCMSKVKTRTEGVPSAVKLLDLGSNIVNVDPAHFACAYKSNCRHQQRAFCEPHMGPTGTIEMKLICQISWMSGSDETDKSDPITYSSVEDDQKVACLNYEKCMELPNEGFRALRNFSHDEALGHFPEYAKKIICGQRTNCLEAKKIICDQDRQKDMGHKIGKIGAVLCAVSYYSDQDERNSIGSRSLGGAASVSQQVLSDVCKSPKDGVCSLV